MEFVAEPEKDADDGAYFGRVEVDTGDVTPVDGGEADCCEQHAKGIEQKWGDICERVLDHDKGRSPQERDEDEKQVRF